MSALCATALTAGAQSVRVDLPAGDDIYAMSRLDLSNVSCFDDGGRNSVKADKNTYGNPLVIRDTVYTSGVGVHAPSQAAVRLNGAKRFVASLGIDDGAETLADHGIVDVTITLYKGSSPTVYRKFTVTRNDKSSYKVNIDLTGYDFMLLDADKGDKAWADHFDYGNAYFVIGDKAPESILPDQIGEDDDNIVKLPAQGSNGEQIVPLSSLDLSKMPSGWGTTQANRSIDGHMLTLKGVKYESGVGGHASMRIIVKLNGSVTRFHSMLGIDDEVSQNGDVNYTVSLHGEGGSSLVAASGNIRRTDAKAKEIDVECIGWKYLILDADANGANSYDHVDWANAYFEYMEQNSTPPEAIGENEMTGTLACASQRFAMPGVRMVHPIVASNTEATLNVTSLPAGLSWNAERGFVEGIIAEEGEYSYIVEITQDGVTESFPVSVTVSSNLIQPTPFMGWLSWNVVEGDISEDVVRTVADAMVSSGVADAGYRYLVIDDLWHNTAREAGTNKPLCSPAKFPNGIKAAADYTHSKGLKFGIYSDAGSHTCAGQFGSYGYEKIDAKAYAEWGVDLLKYDYCNAPADKQTAFNRYKAMGDALRNSGRDILFYICEWGVREPWKWGSDAGGTTWRCTYDTRDGWQGRTGGIGMTESLDQMKDLWPYSGPNRFNDADMMCVAIHGTGRSSNALVVKPGMTQDEYRTQFAMWCMWSSPLTLSFDLRKPISEDDLAIITNTELIAVDQDRLGLQARYLGTDDDGVMLFAKDLENGDIVIAAVNTSSRRRDYVFDLSKIPGLDANTEYTVRDLQNRCDLDRATGSITVRIPTHATSVLRLANESGVNRIEAGKPLSLEVSSTTDGLEVNVNGAVGRDCRVLVSNMSGNIVAAGRTREGTLLLPLEARNEMLIVNAVCGAHSMSQKVGR